MSMPMDLYGYKGTVPLPPTGRCLLKDTKDRLWHLSASCGRVAANPPSLPTPGFPASDPSDCLEMCAM